MSDKLRKLWPHHMHFNICLVCSAPFPSHTSWPLTNFLGNGIVSLINKFKSEEFDFAAAWLWFEWELPACIGDWAWFWFCGGIETPQCFVSFMWVVMAASEGKLCLHQTHLRTSLAESAPLLSQWDCQALCLPVEPPSDTPALLLLEFEEDCELLWFVGLNISSPPILLKSAIFSSAFVASLGIEDIFLPFQSELRAFRELRELRFLGEMPAAATAAAKKGSWGVTGEVQGEITFCFKSACLDIFLGEWLELSLLLLRLHERSNGLLSILLKFCTSPSLSSFESLSLLIFPFLLKSKIPPSFSGDGDLPLCICGDANNIRFWWAAAAAAFKYAAMAAECWGSKPDGGMDPGLIVGPPLPEYSDSFDGQRPEESLDWQRGLAISLEIEEKKFISFFTKDSSIIYCNVRVYKKKDLIIFRQFSIQCNCLNHKILEFPSNFNSTCTFPIFLRLQAKEKLDWWDSMLASAKSRAHKHKAWQHWPSETPIVVMNARWCLCCDWLLAVCNVFAGASWMALPLHVMIYRPRIYYYIILHKLKK